MLEANRDGCEFAFDRIIRGFGVTFGINDRPACDRPAIVELPDQRAPNGTMTGTTKAPAPNAVCKAKRLGLVELRGVNVSLEVGWHWHQVGQVGVQAAGSVIGFDVKLETSRGWTEVFCWQPFAQGLHAWGGGHAELAHKSATFGFVMLVRERHATPDVPGVTVADRLIVRVCTGPRTAGFVGSVTVKARHDFG